MNIAANIAQLQKEIPEGVKLVAVSKRKPNEDIMEAYQAGQRIFGENRPQELQTKHAELPNNIQWHMIGHLQTNKVKYIAPYVALVHAVDSEKLLAMLNKEAHKNDRLIPYLFQLHIADEETKFGWLFDELKVFIRSKEFASYKNVSCHGLMGMATYTNNTDQVRAEFRYLKSSFDKLKTDQFANVEYFKEISMGMSGDYQLAIEEGSTMVRIGSSIFGTRQY